MGFQKKSWCVRGYLGSYGVNMPDIRQPGMNTSCLASDGFPRGIAPWLTKLVYLNIIGIKLDPMQYVTFQEEKTSS
jgi:hypothetical protein